MGKIKKEHFKKAVNNSGGIISTIALRCGVSRRTIYLYLEKYPEMKELVEDESERVLDLAESRLLSKLNDGEDWAVKYILNTKGRKRGWGERKDPFDSSNGEHSPILILSEAKYEPSSLTRKT